MFTLTKLLPFREILIRQVPAMGVSFIIAEVFYKFHSFTLETAAFLVTWYILDGAVNLLITTVETPS
jgi:hypothetical protein